jgi:Ca-activated chloride channel family protein
MTGGRGAFAKLFRSADKNRNKTRSYRRRWCLGVAALLFGTGTVLGPSAVLADSGDSEGSGAESVPTMLILDASGSMAHDDGDDSGATRMEVARQAATALVDDLDDNAELGLLAYGTNTTDPETDKETGCKDVELVTPVASGNSAELKKGIAETDFTHGYTPIGNALEAAAENLPQEGQRSIVLVSDGLDTCAPPPACDVAEKLAGEGIDMAIHTIGFRVDDDAREELSCIADRTGGVYSDAQDGDELKQQLVVRSTRALQGYEVSGTPIAGGESANSAEPVKPGTYLDAFDHGSESYTDEGLKKYYKINLKEGQRLHATATAVPPPGNLGLFNIKAAEQLWLSADVVDRDGKSCAQDKESNIGGDSATFDTPVLATASTQPVGEKGEHTQRGECESGPVYLEVERSGTALKDESVPIELAVAIEPAGLDDSGDPAEPKDNKGAEPGEDPGEITDLGTSFTSTKKLKPGTYAVEMVPGDLRTFGVDVHEGQQLSWSVEPLELGGGDDLSRAAPRLDLDMYNPIRQPVSRADGHTGKQVNLNSDSPTGDGTASPVQLVNRQSDDKAIASNWLGGTQTGLLHFWTAKGTDDEAEHEPSKFLLTLEVDGKAGKDPKLITESAPPKNPTVNDKGEVVGASDNDPGDSLRRAVLVNGGIGAGAIVVSTGAGIAVWLIFRRRQKTAG